MIMEVMVLQVVVAVVLLIDNQLVEVELQDKVIKEEVEAMLSQDDFWAEVVVVLVLQESQVLQVGKVEAEKQVVLQVHL